jgi:hypothetical protein
MREHRRLHDKRRLGGPTKPYTPPPIRQGEVNLTDPDSRRMNGNRRYIQGYNAQAVVNEQQIVVAAEISTNPADFSHLRPMIETAPSELEQARVTDRPTVAVADAQYWNEQHIDHVVAELGIQVLIPPDSGNAEENDPAGRAAATRSCGACSPATPDARPTENARCQSSPSTVTPNTTARSTVQLSRPAGGPHRAAINHPDSQPDQAPPPPNRHRGGLKRPPPASHCSTNRAHHQRRTHERPASAAAQPLCATAAAQSGLVQSGEEHPHVGRLRPRSFV